MRDLNRTDVDLIKRCLLVAAEAPMFPDWEFATLFGLERDEVRHVAREWPDVDDHDEMVVLAVNNSLGNLAGYPHGADLVKTVDATPEQLLDVLNRWQTRQ